MTEHFDPAEPMDAADAERARAELSDLAEHFGERLDESRAAIGGDVQGEQRSLLGDAARRFAHNRIAMVGAIIVTVFAVLAIFVPLNASWNPLFSSQEARLPNYDIGNQTYSFKHLLGTDAAGLDLWKRSWLGARISLSIARNGHEVVVAEEEAAIGTGTSSRNSEVIHGGMYYLGRLGAGAALRSGPPPVVRILRRRSACRTANAAS